MPHFKPAAWILRPLIGIGLLTLIGMACLTLLGFLRTGSSGWRSLNNGWEVRLQGVSFAPLHRYPPNSRLLQYLHSPSASQWLANWSDFEPIHATTGDGTRESLCFWLRLRCPPGAGDNVVQMLADESGHESAAFQAGVGMEAPDSTLLYTHAAFVWPSTRRVALRLYEHETNGDLLPLAEFMVHNPGYARPRLDMVPERFPTAASAGELTVVVEGFGYGPLPNRPHWNRRPTTRPLPFLRLRTLENGRPSAGWQVRHITLSDGAASGLPYESFSFPEDGVEIVPLAATTTMEAAEVPCVLWPGTKAWKVRLVMGIRPGGQWNTNDVRTLSGLTVERSAEDPSYFWTNTTWHPFSLNIVAHRDPAQYANWLPNANGLLEVSLDAHLPDAMVALLDVKDDQGRPIATGPALPDSWGYHGEAMSTRWTAPFHMANDARQMTLSLVMKTNRVVEFVVPAPVFPAAKPFVVLPSKR